MEQDRKARLLAPGRVDLVKTRAWIGANDAREYGKAAEALMRYEEGKKPYYAPGRKRIGYRPDSSIRGAVVGVLTTWGWM